MTTPNGFLRTALAVCCCAAMSVVAAYCSYLADQTNARDAVVDTATATDDEPPACTFLPCVGATDADPDAGQDTTAACVVPEACDDGEPCLEAP
jgi:hypothetical protein